MRTNSYYLKKVSQLDCRNNKGMLLRIIMTVLVLLIVSILDTYDVMAADKISIREMAIEELIQKQSNDFKGYYSPITFPYMNKKSSKFIELLEKAKDADKTEYKLLYKEDNGAFQTTNANFLDENSYFYFGDLKSHRPNGKGVLFKESSLFRVPLLYYCGEFSEGTFDGYGILYEENFEHNQQQELVYEGEFEKGLFNGEGIEYVTYNEEDLDLVVGTLQVTEPQNVSLETFKEMRNDLEEYISYIEMMENNVNIIREGQNIGGFYDKPILDLMIAPTYRVFQGEYKKGEKEGKIKMYEPSPEQRLLYDGQMKANQKNGKGIEYYTNGNKKYEGKFSGGVYNGKGTKYFSDGEIDYKGKFIKGVPKNK